MQNVERCGKLSISHPLFPYHMKVFLKQTFDCIKNPNATNLSFNSVTEFNKKTFPPPYASCLFYGDPSQFIFVANFAFQQWKQTKQTFAISILFTQSNWNFFSFSRCAMNQWNIWYDGIAFHTCCTCCQGRQIDEAKKESRTKDDWFGDSFKDFLARTHSNYVTEVTENHCASQLRGNNFPNQPTSDKQIKANQLRNCVITLYRFFPLLWNQFWWYLPSRETEKLSTQWKKSRVDSDSLRTGKSCQLREANWPEIDFFAVADAMKD